MSAGADATGRPAMSKGRLRAFARRIARSRTPHESSLNLYPMMDLMLIVLVFLMATWATEYAEIEQSAELDIPESSSMLAHAPALSVSITRTAIIVEGERVIALHDGTIDAVEIDSNGFLVRDLYDTLSDRREASEILDARAGREFDGTAQIVGDRRTPFRTIAAAMYTLGQAKYPNVRFVLQAR
jgi:biopolymer transport protein ExbD